MTRPVTPPSPVVRKPPLRHRLHRLTGIATGLALLYLIGTGLPLLLTGPLDLGGRYVASPAILDGYGIGAAQSGWQSDAVSYVNGLVFFEQQPIADAESFQGAVALGDLHAVAAGPVLLVFQDAAPTVVETLPLTAPAVRIGRLPDEVVIDTHTGLWSLHRETLSLDALDVEPDGIEWAHLTTLTGTTLAPLADTARGRVLSFERLFQDLHSGRAFGPVGEWLVGLASLLLAVLAVSGFWIWWRSR